MSNTAQKTSPAATTASALPSAHVAFVGTGPGDPDLLTVRACDLIRRAEVVLSEVPEHRELVRRVLGVTELSTTDADGNSVPLPGMPEIIEVRNASTGTRVSRLIAIGR